LLAKQQILINPECSNGVNFFQIMPLSGKDPTIQTSKAPSSETKSPHRSWAKRAADPAALRPCPGWNHTGTSSMQLYLQYTLLYNIIYFIIFL
jgi:hypothetical protein